MTHFEGRRALKDIAKHDNHEPAPNGGRTLDEEDNESLISDTMLVLYEVLDVGLPVELHNRVVGLLYRIDDTISWHTLN